MLSSMVVMVIVTVALSSDSSTEVNKSAVDSTSNTPEEKREGFDKENNFCEITACIEKIKNDCEMRITVMINPGPARESDIDESYIKVISKSITITLLKDWPTESSKVENPCLGKGGRVSYTKYKNQEPAHDVSHFVAIFGAQRKITLEQKIGECDFTYDELFQVAEGLVQQNKVQLGKETILVKWRGFQELPPATFIKSPIIQKPY